MSLKAIFATSALVASQLVSGHSAITNAYGDLGGSGWGLGVDQSTPRNGVRVRPFQQDTTIFRGASAATCGRTLKGGVNTIEEGTAAIMQQSGSELPQVSDGGSITMNLHQVNTDGAGPYSCMVNYDCTAKKWDPCEVVTNVKGNKWGKNWKGNKTGHKLKVKIPKGKKCKGKIKGKKNCCLLRCQNPARNGPFGGVVPFQQPDAPQQQSAPANAPAQAAPANNAQEQAPNAEEEGEQ